MWSAGGLKMTSMMLHSIAFLCVLTLQSLQATAGVLRYNKSMLLADVLVRSPCYLFDFVTVSKKWFKESKTCPVCSARFVSLGHSSHPEIDGVATLYVQSFPVIYVGLSNLHCAMCLFSLLPTLDMADNGCLLFIAFRPCRDLKVPLPCTSWLSESCEGTVTPTKKCSQHGSGCSQPLHVRHDNAATEQLAL